MNLLIDTNRYRDFCANVPEAVEQVQVAEHIFVSFITLAELRAGFLCGTVARKNERALMTFLASPRASVLFPDEETTHHYAQIFAQLRKQGTPIPANDIWIAALAVQHGLQLFSRDEHFDRLPQLQRV
jgi:predicted nucleic acid-binding protein